jgi:UDP-GlcNAc:undecaprenyl-phosphate GlcNAc-1-phosphate transferase
MDLVLISITALAISMVVIPLMMLLAPHLELLDQPNARKVHSRPMPRVGGWGIVLGALVPILFSLPMDPVVQAFLIGGLVLFVVGVWDDAKGLSASLKLLAQLVAVTPAIFYADLLVARVPFLEGAELVSLAAIPLTYLGMVGMINATNLSDGLDGLAGGESILSLLAIAVLAYQSEGGGMLLVLATASIGGVLGFLRYNTHPARLFMGDSGSQFLGFTAAFLVILLSQKINLAMSPVAPLLVLGLPIIDVVLVFSDRISKGVSPFKPMKNHIHHRLMDLGFTHNQTVVIIYSVHAVMVISGTFYCYSSDASLLVWYFALSAGFLGMIFFAAHVGWRANTPESNTSAFFRLVRRVKRSSLFTSLPHATLTLMVPLVLVFFSLTVQEVPRDFALMAAVLFVVFLLDLLFRRGEGSVTVRVVVYATAVFVVFLSARFHPPILDDWRLVEIAVYGSIVVAIAIAMRLSGSKGFQTTPLDYLILFVVLALGLFSSSRFGGFDSELSSAMIVKSVILLYGCEVLLSQARSRINVLNAVVLLSLGVMGYRGLT